MPSWLTGEPKRVGVCSGQPLEAPAIPGGMAMRKISGIVAAILSLLLWTTPTFPQATAWEQAIAAGMMAHQEGRLAEAEQHFVAAVAEAEALGVQDPRLAGSLGGLAAVFYTQGRYAEAESLLQRALAIREKALGPKHPAIATSLNKLALVYFAQSRYAEAEPLYQRAVAIQEKSLRPDHPDLATTLENYSAFLRKTNRWAEAEAIQARAKAIRAKGL